MDKINGNDLLALGWQAGRVIGLGLQSAQRLPVAEAADILAQLEQVRTHPADWASHPQLGELAQAFLAEQPQPSIPDVLRPQALPIPTWGDEMIDPAARIQMEVAARLPVSVAAALMPDAHVGYGIPIGGVLATEGAVIPYAVGVDIACRMRLSIVEMSPIALNQRPHEFEKALLDATRFGAGVAWSRRERPEHAALENSLWREHPLARKLHAKAWEQLGTSGGGNHFVEWGALQLLKPDERLGLPEGRYLALLSHSGSRGFGAQVANHFTKLAREAHPTLPNEAAHLAWLSLSGSAGAEYWALMELAGQYAAANHVIIHQRVLQAVGLTASASVENHHNFAWREHLPDGTPVIVHRKGATPAGAGVLGVVPGSMADPGYVVRGLGNPLSLNSASHGAGRKLGRNQAFKRLSRANMERYLKENNVRLMGGALDEAPMAYKNIDEVLTAQSDLVEILARFTPRIVRMASDGDSKGKGGDGE